MACSEANVGLCLNLGLAFGDSFLVAKYGLP